MDQPMDRQLSGVAMELVLDAARAGWWDWDMGANQVTRSSRVGEILGLPGVGAEAPPLSWLGRVHPDDVPAFERDLESHLRGETTSYITTFRVRHADGHWVAVESRGQVVARGEDGTPRRMVGLLVDRSGLMRHEEDLRESQRLESLGLLAAAIAHDFNNLLQALGGQLSLAEEQAARSGDVAPLLHRMESVVAHGGDLARQLLDYAGRKEQPLQEVDLASLVLGMSDLLKVSVPASVRLHVVSEAPFLRLRGRPGQLRQVVLNLVTNAADALEGAEGTILVRLGHVRVKGGATLRPLVGPPLGAGAYTLLEVTDSGCGMTEAQAQRIFDPFFTTKAKGRGLGLAALKGIVLAHGGAINVLSSPGQGTTFEVVLPQV